MINRVNLISFVVAALCFFCSWNNTEGLTLEQPEALKDNESYDITQIWVKAGNDYQLNSVCIKRVCELYNQLMDSKGSDRVNDEKLSESLNRYLKQLHDTFEGEQADKACYWMAWLLYQSVTRPELSEENHKETRTSFRSFTEKIIQEIHEKNQEVLGPEKYPKYQSQIKQALDWTEQKLWMYFNELYDDPLFPAFKKPINSYVEEKVLEHVKKDSVLNESLKKPIKLMVLEEESDMKRMENYFNNLVPRVMFWIVLYEVRDEIHKPEYWGGMLQKSNSRKDGPWPIEMYLRPKPVLENQQESERGFYEI